MLADVINVAIAVYSTSFINIATNIPATIVDRIVHMVNITRKNFRDSFISIHIIDGRLAIQEISNSCCCLS
jgi:hypothetical protein